MITRQVVYRWFTTPSELREVADRMEKDWNNRRLGFEAQPYVVIGADVEIRILPNQGAICAREAGHDGPCNGLPRPTCPSGSNKGEK